MDILIDCPRVQMRHFTREDVDAVFEFSVDTQVSRYTGDAGFVSSKDDAMRIIKNVWLNEYEKHGYGRYALVHKRENKVIGFCGFKYDEELNAPDLGYRMLPAYWRQGLASEAVSALLAYGRDTLNLDLVVADAAVENTGSNKVLLNHGFEFVKTQPLFGFNMNHYQIRLQS
ncbi:GNAT family N-acetyltransferase [Thalassotalea sp. Y01]|uniref:GNAT family N-acetyltransferase n=1 Tax=Thalassotalea sp. Y01 TaxID=2729613 RepID=UPI00145D3015|nr:GNAT family N-acetyltransferase [Thalassotalea sp. Y01]NMP16309.1 GNAT family N-acetyltransferase [Thalassotalea sp. Y01]